MATQVRESKKLFWQKVAASSFSIAPSGFGVDTHRYNHNYYHHHHHHHNYYYTEYGRYY